MGVVNVTEDGAMVSRRSINTEQKETGPFEGHDALGQQHPSDAGRDRYQMQSHRYRPGLRRGGTLRWQRHDHEKDVSPDIGPCAVLPASGRGTRAGSSPIQTGLPS